jgi:hypothetical protein
MALDRRGSILAWANKLAGEVTAVDVGSGNPLWSIPVPIATFVDFHPSADVILVKGQTIEVELHDFSSGSPRLLHSFEVSGPAAVAFDHDGDRFAVGGVPRSSVYQASDPTDPAKVWTQAAQVETGAAIPLSLTFLGDDRLVVGQPRNAAVWSIQPDGEVARVPTGVFSWTIDAVPQSSLVLSTRPGFLGGNEVSSRDLESGALVFHSEADLSNNPLHAGAARAVGSNLAIAYLPDLGSVVIFNPSSGEVGTVLDSPESDGVAPWTVDVTADGALAAAIYLGGTDVVLWDASSFVRERRSMSHSRPTGKRWPPRMTASACSTYTTYPMLRGSLRSTFREVSILSSVTPETNCSSGQHKAVSSPSIPPPGFADGRFRSTIFPA